MEYFSKTLFEIAHLSIPQTSGQTRQNCKTAVKQRKYESINLDAYRKSQALTRWKKASKGRTEIKPILKLI